MTGKITKSRAKYIKSLQQKKYRDQEGRFVVEGVKMVEEALRTPGCVDFLVYTGEAVDFAFDFQVDAFSASPAELGYISSLKSPNRILAVCHKQDLPAEPDFSKPVLILDAISDPGNLGTIMRLSDWFDVGAVVVSPHSVDLYNPKVVQATMGAIFRVGVIFSTPAVFLEKIPESVFVYRADMEGENLYTADFNYPFVLLLGSESHGVSEAMRERIPVAVSIPRLGAGESLNVAVSAGIILGELSRRFRFSS